MEEHQPLSGLLTTRQTIALVTLSRTSLFRKTRQGTFPPPCSVGNGQIRWRVDDVRDWMASLPTQDYSHGENPAGCVPSREKRWLS